MLVRDIMTKPAIFAFPEDDIGHAARRMRRLNIGALPVVENGRIVGIVTDRDLVLALAASNVIREDLDIGGIMTRRAICCFGADPVEVAAALMGDHQIRRLPVLDDDGLLAGFLTLADIAVHASEHLAGEVLGEVAELR